MELEVLDKIRLKIIRHLNLAGTLGHITALSWCLLFTSYGTNACCYPCTHMQLFSTLLGPGSLYFDPQLKHVTFFTDKNKGLAL